MILQCSFGRAPREAAVVEEQPPLKQLMKPQEAAGVLESQQRKAEPGAWLAFFNYPSWSNKAIASPHGPSPS